MQFLYYKKHDILIIKLYTAYENRVVSQQPINGFMFRLIFILFAFTEAGHEINDLTQEYN